MIQQQYINLAGGRQIHYRACLEGDKGAEPVLIMLHASPMSSASLVPLMDQLKELTRVIAPDTPGYGNSDALLEPTNDLSGYVACLLEFIHALGLKSIGLYGSATGAQIAIEFARTHPDKVAYLILDNAAHFTAAERRDIMADYFPDISPQADGSHLATIWEMSRGVFQWFPWFQQDEAHRIGPADPPEEFVHKTALGYLQAGSDYARAYKAAFMNEDAARVQAISVPVRVIRWQGSVIKKYCDRYDDFDWPAHVQMVHCEADLLARYQAIKSVVQEFVKA